MSIEQYLQRVVKRLRCSGGHVPEIVARLVQPVTRRAPAPSATAAQMTTASLPSHQGAFVVKHEFLKQSLQLLRIGQAVNVDCAGGAATTVIPVSVLHSKFNQCNMLSARQLVGLVVRDSRPAARYV